MSRRRRETRTPAEIWPGFVDALSTLLLVTIFMLSVFVLAQFFLGQLLQGRDERLTAMQRQLQMAERDLEGERLRLDDLRRSLAQLNTDLGLVRSERDTARSELETTVAEREDLSRRLERTLLESTRLQQTLADVERESEAVLEDRRAIEQALLRAERDLEADRETIRAQLDDLVALRQEVDTLAALRERLEGDIAEQASRLLALEGNVTERETQLALSEDERRRLVAELGQVRDRSLALEAELAQAEDRTMAAQQARDEAVARLGTELEATRAQLGRIETLLAEREALIEAQDIRIEDLGTRLATALAQEVDELQRFRSDFFGRLRQVLGDREDIRVVGDRFVFQSEVLFDRAEATLGPAAQAELRRLAETLEQVTAELPDDLPWILQVNGHTDRRPIRTSRFPSNWELSTERAISVARFLIDQGIPADRVAAAGFGEFQPIDPADSEEAYQRNRRIEIKLTTR